MDGNHLLALSYRNAVMTVYSKFGIHMAIHAAMDPVNTNICEKRWNRM